MRSAAAIALLLLTAPREARACRCDPAAVAALQRDPTSARTAVVGTVDASTDGKRLRVERAWTAATSSLPLETASKCALSLVPGRRYLVLSIHDQGFLEQRGLGLTVCDSHAVELSSAAVLIDQLAKLPRGDATSSNPSWEYCQKDTDCVVAGAACGGSTGINRRYARTHQAWLRQVAPRLNCTSGTSKLASGARCRAQLCEPE